MVMSIRALLTGSYCMSGIGLHKMQTDAQAQ